MYIVRTPVTSQAWSTSGIELLDELNQVSRALLNGPLQDTVTQPISVNKQALWAFDSVLRKTHKMPIVLYKTDGSPPARAAMMVIELLGLKVETSEVFPLSGDHLKPEFLAKNPVHTIPFLEDGKFKLADSHAIITYLVSKYGAEKKAELYPCDLEVRATVDQRMYMDASIIFPKIRAMIGTLVKEKKPVPTEEQVAEVKEIYGILEKYLEQTKFFAANHLTVADISLVASISSLDGLIPVDEYPKLAEWYETFKTYDWYQKANVPGMEKIVGFMKQTSEQLR